MSTKAILALAALAAAIPVAAWTVVTRRSSAKVVAAASAPAPDAAEHPVDARRRADFAAMQAFRPGYAFWQHVFTIPDGSIAFGSAVDGRLLATFPAKGVWTRQAEWGDPAVARILDGQQLAPKLRERRQQVALLLEGAAGPVLHNSTRGDALLTNARQVRPLPRGVGRHLRAVRRACGNRPGSSHPRIGPEPNEALGSQRRGVLPVAAGKLETTELLLTDTYRGTEPDDAGSLLRRVPVRARHQVRVVHPSPLGAQRGRHECRAGADQRRVLGAEDVRTRYFLGSRLALDLRDLPGKEYADVYKSYGPRSYLYAEMVFGNTFNIRRLIASTPQMPISAMRTPRPISLAEIVERTRLPADEVRRFNPALVERVPADAMLYLPDHVSEFGPDVAFWRRPPSPSYVAVLDDFLRLDPGPEQWDDPAFAPVPEGLQAPLPRDEHGGRRGDGDGARVCDGPGIYEQPPHAPVRVPEQREGAGADRARRASARRPAQGPDFGYC